jgi:hypothetical protein
MYQPEASTFPPKPKREELEKWRRFLMEEPPTIVVWDDVKEAIAKHNAKMKKDDGDSSTMSNVSSEADLMSLAPNEAGQTTPPVANAAAATHRMKSHLPTGGDVMMNPPTTETNMMDCGDLKDPDTTGDGGGSFSSIDEDGLFNCLLDDMEAEDGGWDSFPGKEAGLKSEETPFTEVFQGGLLKAETS